MISHFNIFYIDLSKTKIEKKYFKKLIISDLKRKTLKKLHILR